MGYLPVLGMTVEEAERWTAGRSPGEDAEWDRNRVEEEPELWDAAVREKAEAGLPEEVEPCLERLAYPDGNLGGSACDPRWGRKGGWYCGNCKAAVLIMREVKDAS